MRRRGDANELIALHLFTDHPLALAPFYREWTEMADEEVRQCLPWARAS